MTHDGAPLGSGLEVRDATGQPVGTVKDSDATAIVIVIARPLKRTVQLSREHITRVTADHVQLALTADAVDDLWWAEAGDDLRVDLSGTYD